MSGFIKLHRSIMKWGWYTDGNTARVFLHLLLHANWEPSEYLGHRIERGQAVYGRQAMAKDLGMSERMIRTALSHLVATREITIRTTKRFSIATISNYCKYQDVLISSDQQNDTETTATDQQTTSY